MRARAQTSQLRIGEFELRIAGGYGGDLRRIAGDRRQSLMEFALIVRRQFAGRPAAHRGGREWIVWLERECC